MPVIGSTGLRMVMSFKCTRAENGDVIQVHWAENDDVIQCTGLRMMMSRVQRRRK